MSAQLAFLTFGHVIGSLFTLAFGIFVFRKSPKKTHHLVFLLMCLNLCIFWLTYALGISREPGAFTYFMWMGTILLVPHTFLFTHWIFSAIGKTAKEVSFIPFIYAVGAVLFAACILFPHLFIVTMVPKLYLRSYSEPGVLYLFVLAYFLFVPLWPVFNLFLARRKAEPEERNRLTYYLFAGFYGYVLGSIAIFLVFDIPVNPILSVLTVTFLVPLGYGMITQKLMDVKIVIRKALIASVSIASLAGLLAAISLGSAWLAEHVPGLTFWTIPIAVALVAYSVGHIVLRKWQETELLKYEFVTVAAHKLRTPLTLIRWGIEALQMSAVDEKQKETIKTIQEANVRLIKLSDVLLETARTTNDHYASLDEIFMLPELVTDVVNSLGQYAQEKDINLAVSGSDAVMLVRGDRRKLQSVIEVLIDNALLYTQAGGTVTVTADVVGKEARVRVIDSGIGIAKDDFVHISEQFFRSKQAMLSHTEGTGLGLFLAKRIVNRYKGTFIIQSDGEGKGSTFGFTLPLAQ